MANAVMPGLSFKDVEHVELSIGGRRLDVVSLVGEEGVSRLFRFELRCAVSAASEPPEARVAQEAQITLRDRYLGERRVTGVVAEAGWEVFDNDQAELSLVVRPKVYPISLGRDCYVLQDVDVIDVAKDVLFEGYMPVRYEITGSYAKRVYCAQYREDDWTFLSRLLEEEGIYYWFDHDAGETTLVFADRSPSAPDIPGGAYIAFAYETGMVSDKEIIEEIGSEFQATSTKFSVGSFDPARPSFKVTATEGDGVFEVYDAPGGGSESPAVVTARARTMREAAAAAQESVGGVTPSTRLVPGMTFELGGHPLSRLDGKYFITQTSYVIHQRRRNMAGAEKQLTCRFHAIPLATPFRSLPEAPLAKQPGLQLGVVVGPPGEEIHPDAQGRIRVQQHWDRLGPRDHTAGKWVRVAQRPTQGSQLLPRVGWNVASFNEEGAIDAPSLLSRIHDAEHPPAYELPGNMTRVVYKTATSPGAGSFNEIYFEDKKGAEEMFFNASKDMNVNVQNLKNDTVYQDWIRKVGGNHDLKVAKDLSETVTRNQTVDISGNEKLNAKSGRGESVGGDETLSVGADRELEIKYDHSTQVNGKRTLKVGGDLTETTKGPISAQAAKATVDITGTLSRTTEASISEDVGTNATQEITGSKTEYAKRSRTLEVQEDYDEKVGGVMTLKTKGRYIDNADEGMAWDVASEISGKAPEIWIEATKEIRIKCGSSTLVISTTAITFKSAAVDLSGAKLWASTTEIKHG